MMMKRMNTAMLWQKMHTEAPIEKMRMLVHGICCGACAAVLAAFYWARFDSVLVA